MNGRSEFHSPHLEKINFFFTLAIYFITILTFLTLLLHSLSLLSHFSFTVEPSHSTKIVLCYSKIFCLESFIAFCTFCMHYHYLCIQFIYCVYNNYRYPKAQILIYGDLSCSLMTLQGTAQCLVYSRISTNIC